MASEQFSLCWDNFHKNMSSGMNSMLENEDLVDVTLAVEGKCIKAHKMVLSVCSPYFKELFKSNPCQHPIVFMKDVTYESLSDLLQFMYQGEVQVSQDNLTTFIKTAEALQIKGLTADGNVSNETETVETPERSVPQPRVEEYRSTPAVTIPRPRKQPPPSPVVTPTHTIKRQRLSQSSESSQLPPPPVTKTEPISTSSHNISSEPVHFKVEPFDQSHSLIDDAGDDNFGEEQDDSHAIEDSEDYSMMEGNTDDQQAGTSTDGAGEGQGGRRRCLLFHEGYSYSISNRSGGKIYFACSCRRSSNCKARAYIPEGGITDEMVLTRDHSHPPDFLLEKKAEIWRTLKQFAVTLPGKPAQVYHSVVSIYPETEELFPFKTVEMAIRRFRKRLKN